MSDFVVVIPARYASVRLPGKPLSVIAGRPMIEHVHRIAQASGADEVWIATDDERIAAAVAEFGGRVCMTDAGHQSGTERLAEVCEINDWPDDLVVVNLQGDEPLMPPALIDECATILNDPAVDLGTLASPLLSQDEWANPNIVKVVTDNEDNALYFSRAGIPYARDETLGADPTEFALKHHGIYAYRPDILRRLIAAGACDLEQIEKLEQLRALWLGMTLRVGIASEPPGRGVDTEDDRLAVEQLIRNRDLH